MEWCKKAAAQNHRDAQYLAGDMFRRGQGTHIDYQQAVQYYQKAASQGDINALYRMGWALAHGEGIDTNWPEAIGYFRLAAAKGCVISSNNLGFMLEHGFGTPGNQNEEEDALKHYRHAARSGYEFALFNLGFLLAKREGVYSELVNKIATIRIEAFMQKSEEARHLVRSIAGFFVNERYFLDDAQLIASFERVATQVLRPKEQEHNPEQHINESKEASMSTPVHLVEEKVVKRGHASFFSVPSEATEANKKTITDFTL